MFISDLFEEANSKHASFCFGRMNPPTIGHGQLLDTVAKNANGGDYFIFASQTQDPKKNPLDFATKIKFIKALFPKHATHVQQIPELKTIMQVCEWVYKQGYTDVTFVAGSDRLDDFAKLITDYNGVEGKKNYYKFNSVQFASSGDREDGAEGVAGVSASNARQAAAEGNEEAFAQSTGAGKLTPQLYQAVRNGMGINEGWKGALAGAALIGAVGAGMVASNPMTIGGVTYQSAIRTPDEDEGTAKHTIEHNGKKYLVWKETGHKPNQRGWMYKELESQQSPDSKWEPTPKVPTNEGKNTKKIEKGLTRKEAMKKAPWKNSYGDCRGFSYNSETGIASWQ